MGFVVQWVVEEEWGSRKIFKRSTPFISGRGGCNAANQLLSNCSKFPLSYCVFFLHDVNVPGCYRSGAHCAASCRWRWRRRGGGRGRTPPPPPPCSDRARRATSTRLLPRVPWEIEGVRLNCKEWNLTWADLQRLCAQEEARAWSRWWRVPARPRSPRTRLCARALWGSLVASAPENEMFNCLTVCNCLCWDDHCSYGYLWSWKYLSFTNYSLRSGVPVPQEHLEIKDCKIKKNWAFLCWIIDAAKRSQNFETLLCWIIEKLLLPYNPPSQTQCSSHSYCYTHSYATNCFLCFYPFLPIWFMWC